MKKTVRNIAVIAMMASLAAGCQKEYVAPQSGIDKTEPAIGNEIKRTVDYTVDGVAHRVSLSGDMAWKEFLYSLLDMAENGSEVRVMNDDNTAQCEAAKEVVIFTTSDKEEAMDWCSKMHSDGYDVSISYDSVNHVFVCIAEK
jgi:hypothetical protein